MKSLPWLSLVFSSAPLRKDASADRGFITLAPNIRELALSHVLRDNVPIGLFFMIYWFEYKDSV